MDQLFVDSIDIFLTAGDPSEKAIFFKLAAPFLTSEKCWGVEKGKEDFLGKDESTSDINFDTIE